MRRFLQILLQILRLLRPSPGVFLFFIAPIVGELLPGSTPPTRFFNLFTLLFLCFVYGGGAIIARELVVYWGKGWPSLLAFGAAFGVLYEGLLTKSFFDPRWRDIGLLGTYGRWEGVNWVWSVQMVLFHMVFGIALPIMIVGLIFPKRRADRWVGPRALLFLIMMFVAVAILGFLFISPYHPPLIPFIGAALLVAVLILLARFLPRRLSLTRRTDVAQPLRFGLVGLLGVVMLFLINWILPTTLTPWWVTILLTLGLSGVVGAVILLMSGNARSWTDQHQVALVSGALTFFIVLAPFTEIFQRQRDPAGMTLVALLTIALLYLLSRRVRRRVQKSMQQSVVA